MTALAPGAVVDAGNLPLTHAPLPDEAVRDGAPTTAYTVLDDASGIEVGVWEMTPGTAVDVEEDEVFVVLSGRATVTFATPALAPVEIGPGSVMRLTAGMRTIWTVTETLRKISLGL
ncbi:cupin domain-containing protein [Zhihengliuella sp. ISTPL4]|uniref:cupin domain-containing protein n=1 Tax=Zhihengliuella sp. ISTPL4 TaxID=2058657 RepID=UPI000C7C4DA8|nr:cupin domain-containing protein [Zhihengliuella sp. ISTPL4]